MKRQEIKAITCAFLAAVFYAVNIPLSKLLLRHVGETTMAALLYLGAGCGIGIMSLFTREHNNEERLNKKDFPFVIGMILLDIAAPVSLMLGVNAGSPAAASLLGNLK